MRVRGKVDANHKQIVSSLRAIGATVQSLANIGNGCPDILVGYHGKNFLFEIKGPKAKLTEAEEVWHRVWRGSVRTIRSFDEAYNVIYK